MGMKRNEKGVTLVELIIAIGIFVIIAGSIGVFLIQGFSLYGTELKSNADEGDLRNAMTHIMENMRRTTDDFSATTGIVVNSPSKLTVNGKAYTLNNGNLEYNGAVLVKNVTVFQVQNNSGVIDITITAAGKTLSTSYAMK
jgi:prepilin-type N-terminal cleavage/methylation domain-containing protein